jgi:hypothetical protein
VIGPILAAAALIFGHIGGERLIERNVRARGGTAEIDRLVGLIRPQLHGGCLYVFDGEPMLYYRTRTCIPTRYLFPGHLNAIKELDALGIDGAAELRRVLATNPSVIVTTDPPDALRAPSRYAIVNVVLKQRYHLVGGVRIGRLMRQVYALNR